MIKEIFIYYRLLKELLSNNKTNLKADIVKYYSQKLVTYHQNTTVYYSQINKKIENLNNTLKDILTKYLTDKSTIL